MADDVTADAQRVELVDGEVVRQPAGARVHLGTAEGLLVDDLVDRHLHQRWSAQVGRRPFLHHDDVVAHAGDVRAARGGGPEADGDRGDAGARQLREVLELRTTRHEDVGLPGEVSTGGLVQDDHREPVPAGDLVEARRLGERGGVHRSTAVGDVGPGDRDLGALDDPDARDHAGADGVVGPPGGERAQLEERSGRIDERVDPFSDQQLAAGAVPVDVALSAHGGHGRQLLGDGCPQRLHLGEVGRVRLGSGVESRPQHPHGRSP